MGSSSTVTFKRIAAQSAEKTGQSYATTINVVRCRLSFALLWSAITALHGSRSTLSVILVHWLCRNVKVPSSGNILASNYSALELAAFS